LARVLEDRLGGTLRERGQFDQRPSVVPPQQVRETLRGVNPILNFQRSHSLHACHYCSGIPLIPIAQCSAVNTVSCTHTRIRISPRPPSIKSPW
jgi:hypothetical protein